MWLYMKSYVLVCENLCTLFEGLQFWVAESVSDDFIIFVGKMKSFYC